MSNITNTNVSFTSRAATFIADSATFVANATETVAFETGITVINTTKRVERVATLLTQAAPAIWAQAGAEADERLLARLARRGITRN